jgi:hypothetical protein
MGTRTKNQIVLKKQKCGGFLFKIFEPKMSIRSTNVALAGNDLQIGDSWRFSRQFCQCAVIFSFFFFFFCAWDVFFLPNYQAVINYLKNNYISIACISNT